MGAIAFAASAVAIAVSVIAVILACNDKEVTTVEPQRSDACVMAFRPNGKYLIIWRQPVNPAYMQQLNQHFSELGVTVKVMSGLTPPDNWMEK